jgi:hypothetical protein
VRLAASQSGSARTTNAAERLHEKFMQRIKTQTLLQTSKRSHALLGPTRLRANRDAKGRRTAKPQTNSNTNRVSINIRRAVIYLRAIQSLN